MRKLFIVLAMVLGLLMSGCNTNEHLYTSSDGVKHLTQEDADKYDRDRAPKVRSGPSLATKNGNIYLGMTPSEVLTVIKYRPNHINRSTGKWGIHEQWVYQDGWSASIEVFMKRGSVYLYFENEILKSWQD